ncbi:MAG: SufD family Fe-S cluster assembly protein, partial [Parcubacteria group bacterium]|nr:SufD family Fe-S cluster assembly protein [Parcubacteria group bacterium]
MISFMMVPAGKNKIRETRESEWLRTLREEARDILSEPREAVIRYGLSIFTRPPAEAFGNMVFLSDAHPPVVTTPDGVEVSSDQSKIIDALADFPAGRDRAVLKRDPFRALHAAYWNTGVHIGIPARQKIRSPIRIAPPPGDAPYAETIVIISEEGSDAEIIEEIRTDDTHAHSLVSRQAYVFIRRGARLRYTILTKLGENEVASTEQFLVCERDAHGDLYEYLTGDGYVRSAVRADLAQPGATMSLESVSLGSGAQTYDLAHEVRHIAPQSSSSLTVRSILTDSAKTVWRGKVRIETDAHEARAYQKTHAMIFDPNAEMDAVPSLEIENRMVGCHHSVSIGHIDPESLFYAMSRG